MDTILSHIINAIKLGNDVSGAELTRLIRKLTREQGASSIVGKSDLRKHYLDNPSRWNLTQQEECQLLRLLQVKPRRTASGVATITVLTKPWPCSGSCIFCPDDVRMPKSYLSSEPACQRAEQNNFDPFLQVHSRLKQLETIGHPTDKIELIVLGGTWDDYPLDYRIWFVDGLFRALNGKDSSSAHEVSLTELEAKHRENEHAKHRAVGLSVETRPDRVTNKSARLMRELGCTKVQIGIQSLDQTVLDANNRGTSIDTISAAFEILRLAGFKIQVHVMPNLLGATPQSDIQAFKTLVESPRFFPDEIKLYPCVLLENTKLKTFYEQGLWKPYDEDVLIDVLTNNLIVTPAYTRISRMIRDISSSDILAGSKKANLRQLVDKRISQLGIPVQEIRSREIATDDIDTSVLTLDHINYTTSVSEECFIQWITPDNRIAGFIRLSLPVNNTVAMIRELHVYGRTAELHTHAQGTAQHTGLGRKLVEEACVYAAANGYTSIDVISAIGTRPYYRELGFYDNDLYQRRNLT